MTESSNQRNNAEDNNKEELSSTTTTTTTATRPLHVVFIHLDLGIGGAEQLVLQLATASLDLGYRVDVVTTRCDQDHCFAAVTKPSGRLCNNVFVYGRWIPPSLLGVGTALMSTFRMLYITYKVTQAWSPHHSADVVVMDVLPTSLPLLLQWLPTAGILFYCHFPDKLLLRNMKGGVVKKWYRSFLDTMEESTMGLADTLVVNSCFTLGQVKEHFPSLDDDKQQQQQQQERRSPIQVLYPALDTSNMVRANDQDKTRTSPIVSLNRFERKKNIGLLIEAYAFMMKEIQQEDSLLLSSSSSLPPLIIAGGYDTQNVENVEYRGELETLAKSLGVPVTFRTDISDSERATLFQTALCVVYTPDREHFGIVPLEAMYAGTPVLAVNTGGPLETVKDGVTGFLRDPTPQAFGRALLELIQNPTMATTMGRTGRTHVEDTFGPHRFQKEWQVLVDETKRRSLKRWELRHRRPLGGGGVVWWVNATLYMVEAFIVFTAILLLTIILRWLGVLEQNQYIPSALRTFWAADEL
jgi:alpha-1,3/alpha-1,6-mannosyltransferase